MMRVLIGILAFVVYLALIIWLAFALHFAGTKLILFCVILGLLGAAIVAFVLWYLRPRDAAGSGDINSVDAANLAALLRDADTKVRQANRAGAKSLSALPLLYIVGDENSAKTQTVLQSGLDPELLAGNVFQDGGVVPTSLANVWLTGSAALVEAGGPLLKQPALEEAHSRHCPGASRLGALELQTPPGPRHRRLRQRRTHPRAQHRRADSRPRANPQ